MVIGLMVSVDKNGDIELDERDMFTLCPDMSGVHCTVIFTSVSTEGGKVAVHVNIRAVPS